jgi:hypothetical protein
MIISYPKICPWHIIKITVKNLVFFVRSTYVIFPVQEISQVDSQGILTQK